MMKCAAQDQIVKYCVCVSCAFTCTPSDIISLIQQNVYMITDNFIIHGHASLPMRMVAFPAAKEHHMVI